MAKLYSPAPPKTSGANMICLRALPATQLFVDRHFHLKPIAHLLGASPLLGVVLVDRHRARIFDLRLGELTEREDLFHPLPRRGRSDGFAGYDGGHAQRRVEDETRQHFKNVAEALKDLLEKGVFEKWILACQDAHLSAARAAAAFLCQSGADRSLSCRRGAHYSRRDSHTTRSRLWSGGKAIAAASLVEPGAGPGAQQRARRYRTAPRLALARTGRSADSSAGRKPAGARRRMFRMRTHRRPPRQLLSGLWPGHAGNCRCR